MLKQIKKRNLYEEIIRELQKMIENGSFPPGTKLPGERDLAEQLGVNRTTVREALRLMELMRLVEKRPGKGVFVKDFPQEASLESIVFEFLAEDGLKAEVLDDVYEAVLHTESIMARLAAERRDEGELKQLEKIYQKMKKNMNESYNFTLADKEFHLFLSKIAKSDVLSKFAHTIWIIIEKYAYLLYKSKKNRTISLKQHAALLLAIKNRLPDKAYKENWEHYIWAKKTVTRSEKE